MAASGTSLRPRRTHGFGLGVLIGLIIAAVIGLLLVAPVALAHHSAGSLETAYGNVIVSTLARFNAAGVRSNPTTPSTQTLLQADVARTRRERTWLDYLHGRGLFG